MKFNLLRGDEIKRKHIDAIWHFYENTHSKKWGSRYLNQDFFYRIHDSHRHRLLLVLAEKEGSYVAGSFNFLKGMLFLVDIGGL